jgi:uncharacterized protein YhdP
MLGQNGRMKALPPFLRVAVWSALGLITFGGAILLAYELALARVPQHRAALERLVRSQTGLDVRFNELNLHWGWYGPEAIFHRVELGEPGRLNVLVRAPQLTVGFDAWRSVQSGQLQAGRITFIAPEINLERNPASHAQSAADPAANAAASQYRTRLLQRWRGGRIDIEGGTLRLPDPSGSADALTLQIRSASLRRSKQQWSASALLFLPERLGHTARLAAQLDGDLTRLASLSGSVRFEGMRLSFAGWRQVLGTDSAMTRNLPAAGEGDVSFRMTLAQGQLQKAEGRVHSQDVLFAKEGMGAGTLNLKRLRGDWRLLRRSPSWQLRVADLDLGAQQAPETLATLALEFGVEGQEMRGEIAKLPVESLAALASWLAPEIDLSGARLDGLAREVRFDWNRARLQGARLQATAHADNLSFAPPSGGFTLSGLKADLAASENGADITLESEQARLILTRAAESPLEDLRIVSELRLSREERGWHLNTPLLTVDRGATELILSGSLTSQLPPGAPQLDLHATLVRAEIPLLQQLLGEAATRYFGAVATQLTSGRIERAQFQLQGELERAPQSFAGSLSLRDGQLTGGDLWPDVQQLDAQLEWNGPQMRVVVDRGHAGSIQLVSGRAQWSTDASRRPTLAGQVRGRLEDALQWLRAHPQLEEYVPQLRNFAATGEALFNFDIAAPKTVRVALLLSDAQLQLAEDLPAIESIRGSLAFERSRLQRSTLTGSWLGGPLTLRLAERHERRATTLDIQAQGLLDAHALVALTGFDPLPEVSGQTPWAGTLAYQLESPGHPAHWQLQAEASLVGVSSRLPEPLSKTVVMSLPLHVEASGTDTQASVRVNLGDRLHSNLALVRAPRRPDAGDTRWLVDRGAIRFGSGTASIPAEPLIAVQGEVNQFDFPAYASLWQRAGNLVQLPAIVADLVAQQLWLADRAFPEVRVQGRKAAGTPAELNLESVELNGSVRWPSSRAEVHLTAQNLDAAERARIVTQLKDSWNEPVITLN